MFAFPSFTMTIFATALIQNYKRFIWNPRRQPVNACRDLQSRSAPTEKRLTLVRQRRAASSQYRPGKKVRGPAQTPAWLDHEQTPPSVLPSRLAKPCKVDFKGVRACRCAKTRPVNARRDLHPTGTSETGIST